MGREVAEAYINVHGDLSPFRRDLQRANEGMEKLARQNADNFSDAWGKRMAQGVDRQWNSILDGMYNAEGFDPNKLVKDFNSKNLDEAEGKILGFLERMSKHQKITGKNYKATKKAVQDIIKATRDQQDAEEQLAKDRQAWDRAHLEMMDEFNKQRQKQRDDQREDQKAWMRANDDMVRKFREVRKAYDESFDGMFKTEQAKRLTEDLKGMVKAMEGADWSKFAKGFDTFDDMRERINEVNKAMFEQGKISQENISRINRAADEFITAEKEKQKAVIDAATANRKVKEEEQRLSAEALAASRAAREEARRLEQTFEGMVNKATIQKLESDFRRLSQAVATNDWSSFTRHHDNFKSMHVEINRIIGGMHSMGRMSDDSLGRINIELDMMRNGARGFNGAFRQTGQLADALPGKFKLGSIALSLLTQGVENLAKKMAGMGGLNVISDMLRTGSEFMQNIDRHAVSWAKNMTIGAGALSAVISSIGGISVIGTDLSRTIGGLAAFIPAFATGLGIGIASLVAVLKDMKTVLKDLGPGFKKLQDNMSKAFWDKAAQPIRDLTNNTMPLLNEKLSITSENLAGMFTEFTRQLDSDEFRNRASGMFDRMNSAIKISQGMIAPLTNAFTTLAEVGSLYFERFATWLVDISNKFNDFIQKAAADGRLQKWMDDAIQGLKDLWSIAGSVVGIFSSISDAAKAAGSTGLHGFAENMREIERIMSSDRFKSAMTTVFQSAGTVMEGFKEGFKKLGPAFESALPEIAAASTNFKSIIETAFGYVAQIIANPKVQEGFLNFSSSIKKALDTLAPSIPVIADGLGGLMSFMGTVLENVARVVNQVIIKLSPVFDKMMEKLEPLIPVIGDLAIAFIDSLAPILEEFVDEILPPLIDLFKDVAPQVADFLKQITPGVVDTIKSFGKVLRGIADAVDWLTDQLDRLKKGGDLEWLGTMIEGLASGPNTEAFDKMGEMIANWFKDWITQLGEDIGKWWDEGPGKWWDDHVGKWFDDVRKNFEDAWNGFTSWLDSIFGGGGDEGSSTGGAGSRGIGKVIGLEDLESPDKWAEFWGGIQGHITSFFEGIGAWIEEQSAGLKEGWDNFWNGFGEKVKEIWDGFWTFIVEKYTEIKTGLETWWTDVKTNWDNFWNGMGTKVEEAWNGFWTFIDTKKNEIKTNIDSFATDVKTNWDNFWNGVKTKLDEIWNGMKSFIDTKVTEIKDGIKTKTDEIKTNWESFWTSAQNKVRDTWESVKNWIQQKVGEIRNNIDNFVSTVRNNWNSFWAEVPRTVEREWNNLTQGIQNGINRAISFVQTFPDRVRSLLNFDLFGAGSSIMSGFLNGLKSMWGNITSFVGGIAEWIKNNKGPIEYDRVLLTPAGEAIMQSLVNGLRGGMAGLENQVNLVTDQILSGVTQGLARSAMYAAGADAALGLADGLSSKAGDVERVFKNLIPDSPEMRVSLGSGRVGQPTPSTEAVQGKRIVVENMNFHSNASDEGLLAEKVVDELVDVSNL